jgi:hypothetical protein
VCAAGHGAARPHVRWTIELDQPWQALVDAGAQRQPIDLETAQFAAG